MNEQQQTAEWGRMTEKLDRVVADVKEIKELLAEGYVSKAEFGPVRNIVYGGTGLGLLGVGYALLRLIGLK